MAGHKFSGAINDSVLSEIVVGDIVCDSFLADQLEANGLNEETAGFSQRAYDQFLNDFIEDDFSAKDTEKLIEAQCLLQSHPKHFCSVCCYRRCYQCDLLCCCKEKIIKYT